jgi:hypothetical protein
MKILMTLLLLVGSLSSIAQNDYTFCYGDIALTLFDGGDAEMVRYRSNKTVISRVKGTYELYGKGNPTEVLRIQFQNAEYRYDLVRDGYGIPSKIFDSQMREYKICKSSAATNNNSDPTNLSFFTGKYSIPDSDVKVVLTIIDGVLNAEVYKNGVLYEFKTTCGAVTKFAQGKTQYDEPTRIYLLPKGCNDEPEDPATWKPNYIELESGDMGALYSHDRKNFPDMQYYYLNIKVNSTEFKVSGKVKKVTY